MDYTYSDDEAANHRRQERASDSDGPTPDAGLEGVGTGGEEAEGDVEQPAPAGSEQEGSQNGQGGGATATGPQLEEWQVGAQGSLLIGKNAA